MIQNIRFEHKNTILSSMPLKHMGFMSSRNGTIQLKLRDVPQIKDFLLIIVLLDIARCFNEL